MSEGTIVKTRLGNLFRAPDFDWAAATTPEDFVRSAEDYFVRVRQFYDSRARWNRRLYRFSGILLIVLGGALPLIAGADFTGKDVLIAVIGFVVATTTALRGFYNWDSGWVLMRETEFMLTKRYVAWKALQVEGPDPAVLREETRKLLEDLIAIREKEARSFFKDLPLPAKDKEGTDTVQAAQTG